MSVGTIALDGVLYPVEEEVVPQELEQLSFNCGWDVRLEIEEVEIGLIVDIDAWRSRHVVQLLDNVWWKVRKGERIGCVIGKFGVVYCIYLGVGRRRFCSQADLFLRCGREKVVEGSFLGHYCSLRSGSKKIFNDESNV